MRKRLVAACVASALVGWPTSAASSVAATATEAGSRPSSSGHAPPGAPFGIASVGDASQLITVTASSWSSTRGWLRAYQRDAAGRWRLVLGPWRARLGCGGFVLGSKRIQATGTTPVGSYRLVSAFGGLANPGTRMRYTRITPSMWWPYDPRDPRTYNLFQTSRPSGANWRTNRSEHLIKQAAKQYRYSVVIDFNLPRTSRIDPRTGLRVTSTPANTKRGGGIFLHVEDPTKATAGCVAVSLDQMRKVLRWLDPASRPRIVMGPEAALASPAFATPAG